MNEVKIDVSGTVVSDPVLRRTRTGDAFLTFRLAVNSKRWKKDAGWLDGESQYFSVTAFRVLAGNAYHSLSRGQSVLVSGRLRMSSYTTSQGEVRSSVQIDAHDIGPSLKFGQTTFEKVRQPVMPSDDRMADEAVEEARREIEEQEHHLDVGESLPLAS